MAIPRSPIGMPFAWTHRFVEDPSTAGFTITQDISNNGYSNPDWGYQVYIGFPYGSAALVKAYPIMAAAIHTIIGSHHFSTTLYA